MTVTSDEVSVLSLGTSAGRCNTHPFMVEHVALHIHFIGLHPQLLCQPENPVLGRSHICSTNIYITHFIILWKRIQASEAVQGAPQYKHLEAELFHTECVGNAYV